MPKVQFIFAIYNHQPVGNFEFVAEEAYQKAHLPFINVLERHQSIRITLHYTGILYRFFAEWLRIRFALAFDQPAVLWRAPVETASPSEAGFERVYQSSMVMPRWRISLSPGKRWITQPRVKIE